MRARRRVFPVGRGVSGWVRHAAGPVARPRTRRSGLTRGNQTRSSVRTNSRDQRITRQQASQARGGKAILHPMAGVRLPPPVLVALVIRRVVRRSRSPRRAGRRVSTRRRSHTPAALGAPTRIRNRSERSPCSTSRSHRQPTLHPLRRMPSLGRLNQFLLCPSCNRRSR